MKRWGFGLIGCGSVADFHMNAIREIEQARLVAISDRKEQRAKEIGAKEGCAWTTDYKELLANPEVEIVCLTTSSGTHGSIGREVLLAGKHLVVEKPIAMTSREARELVRLADEKGLTLSVISQRRFEAQHQWVHQVLEEGKLGKLLLVQIDAPYYRTQQYYDSADWRGTIAEDGGALMNQGIHSIDLMLWMGGKIRSVYGQIATQTHRMEAEDLGLAIVKFENGAYGTIMASTSIQPGFQPSLYLYGERGSIQIEGTTIKHWTVEGVDRPGPVEAATSGGGVSDPKSISNLYHRLQLIDVIESLNTGRPVIVSGEDGLRSVELVEAIYKSSSLGKEIVRGEDWP
ncbi:Gfo/Idh/MocA family protein [Paenibacillus sp. J2TS4]|uniref:Gfo/Idh/MocA family protein n=1 Tax=Paenibacillus sp. J2TS4 TaxID=2807194 RepID=UPI001B19A18A|nr:Gfo/Idh/MocA family oxidoreductase [Paenibacillus sp. J2TS4]GIP32938.1 oxidoreductase [Paenibacillus sp. J2TS4]